MLLWVLACVWWGRGGVLVERECVEFAMEWKMVWFGLVWFEGIGRSGGIVWR